MLGASEFTFAQALDEGEILIQLIYIYLQYIHGWTKTKEMTESFQAALERDGRDGSQAGLKSDGQDGFPVGLERNVGRSGASLKRDGRNGFRASIERD
jgi:hypothetical protein